MLLTPHGFQAMLLLFLPIPALYIENFPYPYHRIVYQQLANNIGVYSAAVSSPSMNPFVKCFITTTGIISVETCNKYYLCRNFVGNQDVMMTKEMLEEMVTVIIPSYLPNYEEFHR